MTTAFPRGDLGRAAPLASSFGKGGEHGGPWGPGGGQEQEPAPRMCKTPGFCQKARVLRSERTDSRQPSLKNIQKGISQLRRVGKPLAEVWGQNVQVLVRARSAAAGEPKQELQ